MVRARPGRRDMKKRQGMRPLRRFPAAQFQCWPGSVSIYPPPSFKTVDWVHKTKTTPKFGVEQTLTESGF